MKFLITFFALVALPSIAASVRVLPFELNFFLDNDRYDVDFKLEMVCRYEKFVIGNSSKYESKFKSVPLKVDKYDGSVRISNTLERSLSLDGMFKYGKECNVISKLYFVDNVYAVGWASKFDTPIRLGVLDHTRFEENAVFDGSVLRDYFENKEISFLMKPISNMVHIWLAFDGIKSPDISLYSSALKNPETELPYKLP